MACPRHLSLQEALRRDLDFQLLASEGACGREQAGSKDFPADPGLDGQLCALRHLTQQESAVIYAMGPSMTSPDIASALGGPSSHSLSHSQF